MGYKLTVDIPTSPKGEKIQIAGLDTFENGETYVITDAEHEAFRRYHGHTELQYNDKNEVIGSELAFGPTLIQSNIYGIHVEVEKESDEDKKKRKEEEAAEKQRLVDLEATRRTFAKDEGYDLSILSDTEVDSWIFDQDSSVAQDAEAKLVVAKTEKGVEN